MEVSHYEKLSNITEKINSSNSVSVNKKINKDSFQDIMKKTVASKKDMVSNKNRNYQEEDKKKIDQAFDTLTSIFDADIRDFGDKYINEDNTVNVHKMIDELGDYVSSDEMTSFGKAIGELYDKGMISREDFFFALRWIAAKVKGSSVKVNADNISMEIIKDL